MKSINPQFLHYSIELHCHSILDPPIERQDRDDTLLKTPHFVFVHSSSFMPFTRRSHWADLRHDLTNLPTLLQRSWCGQRDVLVHEKDSWPRPQLGWDYNLILEAISNAKKYLQQSPVHRKELLHQKAQAAKRQVYFHLPFHPNHPSLGIKRAWKRLILKPLGNCNSIIQQTREATQSQLTGLYYAFTVHLILVTTYPTER